MDSNGDGIGDLQGIISKLDYLKDLGITAIWMSPVYPSPNADNGYDVADYLGIMPEFGTLGDWQELADGCHQRGIKIIMDIVVNHSSDEHPWFIESAKSKTNDKSDYYIWHDPVEGKEPNNWRSVWGGSAWEYVPEREQNYLHLFSKKQPDLNWSCEELKNEIYSMMEKWVQLGTDGFRVDAISYLDKPIDFPDSPEPSMADGYSFCMEQLIGRDKTHRYIHGMNEALKKYGDVLMVGEVVVKDTADMQRYVLDENEEFSMAIPFVPPVVEIEAWSPKKLKEDLFESYESLKSTGWCARFLSNHDKPRQVSLYGKEGEFGEQSAKMLATFIHTLPGTPFVYQGEELGMTNVYFDSIEEYDDIDTRTYYEGCLLAGMNEADAFKKAQHISRDNARTPMHWNSSKNAGFTTGDPWLKINENYLKINAEKQINDPDSVISYYKKLITLRKENKILVYGDLKFITLCDSDNVISYTRSYKGETWLIINNFSDKEITLSPAEYDSVILGNSKFKKNSISAYEAVIIKI